MRRAPLDRSITKEELATTYTNYYEFGSSKNIRDKAQYLPIRPWMVSIAGKVEQEMTYPGQIRVNVIRETRAVEYAK